jgi:hypothetical protein
MTESRVLAMDSSVTYTYDNLYRLASDARRDIGRAISRASEDHYGSGENGRGSCTRYSASKHTQVLGAKPLLFVLDSQTQLAQAELNLILAQVNLQLAVAQLDHATGDLFDHHHVRIVEPSK